MTPTFLDMADQNAVDTEPDWEAGKSSLTSPPLQCNALSFIWLPLIITQGDFLNAKA